MKRSAALRVFVMPCVITDGSVTSSLLQFDSTSSPRFTQPSSGSCYLTNSVAL